MQRTLLLCSLVCLGAAIKCDKDDAETCASTQETDEASMLQSQMSVEKIEKDEHKVADVKAEKKALSDKSTEKTEEAWGFHRRRRSAPAPPPQTSYQNNIELKVTLQSGSGLGPSDFFDTVDPFCTMWLKPTEGSKNNTLKTSSTQWDEPNPTFNTILDTFDYSSGDVIEIQCFDAAQICCTNPIGKATVPLTRGSDGTVTASLSTQGTLSVKVEWTTCSSDCQSLPATMAQLAGNVYSFYNQASNYHLIEDPMTGVTPAVAGFATANVQSAVNDGEEDNMALYKNYQSGDCALVFSGSNDNTDWVNNIKFFEKTVCGFQVHSGFGQEVLNYFSSPAMAKFSSIISSQCGGTAYFVGHSLGGAVADIAAACANSPSGLSSIGSTLASGVTPFTAKGIYTIGAPAVADPALQDNLHGGCFPGLRAFNLDSSTYDTVPWLASTVGYSHPEMESVQLHEDGDETLSMEHYPCSASYFKYPYGLTTDGVQVPSASDHSSLNYWSRLQELYPV